MLIRATSFGIAFAVLASTAVPLVAQELPPLPATLLNASGAVCISISRQGGINGAYVLTSTGDAQADRDMLAWVRQLRWPVATPDETMRDTWFPMPIGFREKKLPKVPTNCPAPA